MKNLEPDISSTTPIWGLQCVITPRLGTRLIQQGRRLHFLADRAGLIGTFTPEAIKALDVAFPVLIEQLENYLRSGELDPRRQNCVTFQHAGFTCEADTLGSSGYVYIAVYQSKRSPVAES
ncbi:type IV toxin-antitoxin system YeeU family antitoxin [Serratia fonticola]|uniref:type IV toxin-antitoxin system YeeU family antitoxin n=1 Tax=Serratia fonticola TaxID=47917 RepID=UPI001644EA54|nr:type IV toxin-antitoxin system YeeU family antitoxin [Serratia fonticola]MBC3228961.1 type IV toxin-antitoxin system YeeU family antitoxin [Serratia fonticola]